MIRYYNITENHSKISVYTKHNHRLYDLEIIYFYHTVNKTHESFIFINRKDIDISKMYASTSEDLYNMLKSDDEEMVNMAFNFIFGQLGKEK